MEVVVRLRRVSDNKDLSAPVHVNRLKLTTNRQLRPINPPESQEAILPLDIDEGELPVNSFEDPQHVPDVNQKLDGHPSASTARVDTRNQVHTGQDDPVASTSNATVGSTVVLSGGVVSDQAPQPQYDVEKIIKVRYTKTGKREYLLKWVGFPPSANLWEPWGSLNEACRQHIMSTPIKITGRRPILAQD